MSGSLTEVVTKSVYPVVPGEESKKPHWNLVFLDGELEFDVVGIAFGWRWTAALSPR
jgi:hypothetical protein